MSERTEALRRFPPPDPKMLVPMTFEPGMLSRNWRLAFEQTTDPSRKAQILRGIAETERVTPQELNDILARVSGLPDEANIRWAVEHKLSSITHVPQTVHQYGTVPRTFMDEMEGLHRSSDQKEYYRRKKLVRQAIKERERGKMNTYPAISLTDLRQILKELNLLYD